VVGREEKEDRGRQLYILGKMKVTSDIKHW
jgi:hypothetical protein